MRFIAKAADGSKYIEGFHFTWMNIPTDAHLNWVKIQGKKKSFEFVFKNASGYYFMNEAIATPGGSKVIAKILGVIDGRKGSVEEHRIDKDGHYSLNRFKKEELLDKIQRDQFNAQIIRMGI